MVTVKSSLNRMNPVASCHNLSTTRCPGSLLNLLCHISIKNSSKKYAGKQRWSFNRCAENAIKKKRSKKSVSAFTLLPVISFLFLPTSGGVLTTTPLYTQPRTPQCQKRWRSRREIFPFFFFLAPLFRLAKGDCSKKQKRHKNKKKGVKEEKYTPFFFFAHLSLRLQKRDCSTKNHKRVQRSLLSH